ncbi:SRP19 protein [Necator americanus]|uniref:SRP19 protein n=1 Tax=Necator americanus TaxID=51031 RepID=W2SMC5_NECAM|nr:SRP19 protein [Necator americanus]ETN70026.1 SRP19 protein [Necator americanus]
MADAKSKPFSDEKRWVVIYPTYINSKRTTVQGRKIPKQLVYHSLPGVEQLFAVDHSEEAFQAVENPTSTEIRDVLAATGLNPVLERGKLHPREQDREPENRGRVRVQLKNDDGTAFNKDYPTRAALLKYVASMIPKLKTRQPGYVATAAGAGSSTAKKIKKKK